MTKPLYIVLHSPKTAGQTLNHNFRHNFNSRELLLMYSKQLGMDDSPESHSPQKRWWDGWWDKDGIDNFLKQRVTSNTKCLFGHHLYFGVHKLINFDREFRYITFLRDPVERVISAYFYQQRNPHIYSHQSTEGETLSLEDWLKTGTTFGRDNGQLRYLLSDLEGLALEETELTQAHLAEGLARLEQFWFFGLTDTFDEDTRYLYGKLGFWRVQNNLVVNATPRRQAISPQARELIIEHNQLDLQLFSFAKQLHEEFITRQANEFKFNQFKASVLGLLGPLWPGWDMLVVTKDRLWTYAKACMSL